MVTNKTDELREILENRDQFKEMACFFIEKASLAHEAELIDPRFGRYLKMGLYLLLEENISFAFDRTESPLEKLFINSLLLAFIKNDPLNLVIEHSVRNAPNQIEAFHDRYRLFKEFSSWYKKKFGSLAGSDEFIDHELARGRLEAGEHHYLRRHLAFYEFLGLENRYHLIVQPGIPGLTVEGKTVRPDLLIWVPSDDSVRIIVECEGFQNHDEKADTSKDRKRDRTLKAKGYEILSYSGSEINNDPVAASIDLAEYLWSRAPSAYP
jgi:hypothetical protein